MFLHSDLVHGSFPREGRAQQSRGVMSQPILGGPMSGPIISPNTEPTSAGPMATLGSSGEQHF